MTPKRASTINGEEGPERALGPPSGSWSRVDTILVVLLYVVVVGSTRSVVSVDSHLYLSSAKSLLTGDVDTWFHWIREPLLPALLKTTNAIFGSSDLGYLLTMSALVLGSLVVFSRAAFPAEAGLRRAFLIVTALNPLLHGFVGHVGQQALALSIVTLGAAWALTESEVEKSSRRRLRSGAVAGAFIGAACTLTSFLLFPVALAVAVTPLVIRWTRSGSYATARDRLLAGRPFVPSVVVVLAAFFALGGWWGYKAIELEGAEPGLRFSGVWVWDYDVSGAAYDRASVGLIDKLRGLTAFGPEQHLKGDEIVLRPAAHELRIYGGLGSDWSEDSCGIADPGPQRVEDFVGDYFQLSCRPSWGQLVRAAFGRLSLYVYRGAEVALLLSAFLSFWKRRYLVLVLPAVAVLAPYLVGGLGISRYAFPLWPLGVAAMAFMVQDVGDWIRRRRLEGTPDLGGS